jgi:parallel beta-helix repeat protein
VPLQKKTVEDCMRKLSVVVSAVVVLGVLFAGMSLLPQARATTLQVGGVGPGNYTTIQSAIDDADPGDTIFVHSGTYPENVVVPKTLTLTGEDRDTTTIDAEGNGDAVEVSADWVNITGFTLNGSKGLFRNDAALRLVGARNAVIENNIIINSDFGIFLDSSAGIDLSSNRMVDNGIHIQGDSLEHWNTHTIQSSNTVNDKSVRYLKNLTGPPDPSNPGQVILANHSGGSVSNLNIAGASVGIEVAFSSNITIYGNHLSNHTNYGIHLFNTNNSIILSNTAVENGKHGIWLYESHNNMIRENDLSSNNKAGIFLTDSSKNEVKRNQAIGNHDGIGIMSYHSESDFNYIVSNNASSNTWFGVWLDKGSNNTIANNTASQNGREGIHFFRAHDNTIISNNAHGNIQYGIGLWSSDRNTASSSNVTSNGWQGAYLTSSSGNSIFGNNFVDNTEQGYDDTGANEWDSGYPSGGNHWSNYSGIDQFSGTNQNVPGSDGIGDTEYTIDVDSHDRYPLMAPVASFNTPPIADFDAPTATETGEEFLAYAAPSDLEDPSALLEVRWDWQNDGVYDTGWSANKSAVHQYPIVDNITVFRYRIRMQVRDTGGLTDSALQAIMVYPPQNDPPTCSITSPTPMERLSEVVVITGHADDDAGVLLVEISLDGGQWMIANGTTSWSYEWDTTSIALDLVFISARSYDGEFYSSVADVEVWVENRLPPPSDSEDLFGQAWFWAIIVIAIIVPLILLIFLWRRKLKKNESPPSS